MSPRAAALVLALIPLSGACERCAPDAKETPMQDPDTRLVRHVVSELPPRRGPRPKTSDAPPGTNLAHRQLTQNAPVEMQEALFELCSLLPDVELGPSRVSVPGARAFFLAPDAAAGPREAFMVGTEFAHIHPHDDGSLHMRLPPALEREVFEKGWGEPHPRSGTPLVYGPRDADELEIVLSLARASWAWARTGRSETGSACGLGGVCLAEERTR